MLINTSIAVSMKYTHMICWLLTMMTTTLHDEIARNNTRPTEINLLVRQQYDTNEYINLLKFIGVGDMHHDFTLKQSGCLEDTVRLLDIGRINKKNFDSLIQYFKHDYENNSAYPVCPFFLNAMYYDYPVGYPIAGDPAISIQLAVVSNTSFHWHCTMPDSVRLVHTFSLSV